MTWDTLEFAGVAGTRVQLTKVDGPILTFDPGTASGPVDPTPMDRPHAKVRRWDQRGRTAAPLVKGAVEVVENTGEEGWIPLEDGIEIQFQSSDKEAHTYRVGDYWTIPARVATGDIIWPRDADGKTPSALPPFGIEHHYAPLWWFGDQTDADLRLVFGPLAQCATAAARRRRAPNR